MAQKTCKFEAEIEQVLHLMIHSLYTNKDIFLRELVSNASDACDKLRFISNTTPDVKIDKELSISIEIDEKQKTITISDNGIGMNEEDLLKNIGTVASSGTKKFLEEIKNKNDTSLIGQFGVGFYSVFMVASKVELKTKKYNSDKAYIWVSNGIKEYTIEECKKESCGTSIIIHLKDEELGYLDKFKIEHIVSTYSDHISVPVLLKDEGKDKPKTLNSSSALWLKKKSEISEKEYQDFYKKTAISADKPWMTIHNHNEGIVNFTNLLFIPSEKTFDLFHPDRKRRVKLYVNRVFINDESIDMVPHYLRFLRGVVDSQDLPLNISRENLQHNKILHQIKDSITKKVINLLEKKLNTDRESYVNFWKNFGQVVKEGLCESMNVPENLIDTCLFWSAKENKYITVKEYINNAKDHQKDIYYVSGDDFERAKQHPQIETFLEKGYDVLFFIDTVDDFWVSAKSSYKDFNFKAITRSNINLDGSKKTDDFEDQKTHEELIKFVKDTLGNKVEDVIMSSKLSNSPSCISVKDGALDIRMERYLIEQKQLKEAAAKILELNGNHKIVQEVNELIKADKDTDECKKIVKLLFAQACIAEGEQIHDSKEFSSYINDLIESKLAIS